MSVVWFGVSLFLTKSAVLLFLINQFFCVLDHYIRHALRALLLIMRMLAVMIMIVAHSSTIGTIHAGALPAPIVRSGSR